MQSPLPLRRPLLLALSFLSACGAAGPSPSTARAPDVVVSSGPPVVAPTPAPRRRPPVPSPSGALLTGRHALSQGDLDAAALAYQRALGGDMQNEALRQQAFLASLMAGRPEAERLAGLLAQNQAAQLVLAGRDARAGNWAQAEARFAALPREGAADVMRPLLIAWAQVGRGQPDAALATLQPLVDNRRFRAFYALHAALIADLADRTSHADRLYRTAETEFGGVGHLQLGRQIASWQARQGDRAEAEATLRAMAGSITDLPLALPGLISTASTPPVRDALDGLAETYLVIASVLRGQDSSDFALVLTRLAMQLRPNLAAARLLASELIAGGKRPEASLELLAPVSADDPLYPVAQMRRVRLLYRLDRTDEALDLLAEVAAAHPDSPEPMGLMGDILRIKHRFAEAVEAYDKALARSGPTEASHWPLYYDRAIALERSGQWDRAEADFLKALELSPGQPHVLNYLAYSWTEQGRNLDKAREMIERAVEQRPNDGAMVDSQGWVAMRTGDVATAVRLLERAAELEPGDPTINGHLGDAYWAAGRRLEAVYQWRRALNLKPEGQEKARIEERLRSAEQTLGITP